MTKQEAVRILDEQRNKFMDEWIDFGGVNEAYNMAIRALKEQLYIVRCKDCKHGEPNDCGEVICDLRIGDDAYRPMKWFCADGKRK